nr:IS1634 family transposase [Argonema antarcticum]
MPVVLLTRVPLSIKEAQNKSLELEPEQWTDSQIPGYKIAEKESNYGGIKQRWLIIESEARKKASIQQVSRQVEKQKEKASAALRQLYRQKFACQPDAKIAVERLSNYLKYHEIKDIEYAEKASYEQSGRPSKLTKQNKIKYQVKGRLEIRLSVIEAEKTKAGRFILATNVVDNNELTNDEVRSEYKAQQSNQRGFRFLKDPLFFTASVLDIIYLLTE